MSYRSWPQGFTDVGSDRPSRRRRVIVEPGNSLGTHVPLLQEHNELTGRFLCFELQPIVYQQTKLEQPRAIAMQPGMDMF